MANVERTVSSNEVFSGRVIKVRVDEVQVNSGRLTTREIVVHRGAVGIVPFTDDGRVVLVRQYRYAVSSWLLEIPAGTLEPGEAPEECARRELVEETGFEAGSMKAAGSFYTTPGFTTEKMHLFIATDLREAVMKPEEDEFIEVITIPVDELYAMIDRGEISDAKTIIGLLLAKRL